MRKPFPLDFLSRSRTALCAKRRIQTSAPKAPWRIAAGVSRRCWAEAGEARTSRQARACGPTSHTLSRGSVATRMLTAGEPGAPAAHVPNLGDDGGPGAPGAGEGGSRGSRLEFPTILSMQDQPHWARMGPGRPSRATFRAPHERKGTGGRGRRDLGQREWKVRTHLQSPRGAGREPARRSDPARVLAPGSCTRARPCCGIRRRPGHRAQPARRRAGS